MRSIKDSSSKENKELIGIGFVLPTLWESKAMHIYLPIEVRMRNDSLRLAVLVNEKDFHFKYILIENKK